MSEKLADNDVTLDDNFDENEEDVITDKISDKEAKQINQIVARRKIEERLEQQRLQKELGDFDDWD